jgi:hypothetical protein
MLKFLLDRILPKERPVHLDLPAINHFSDAIVRWQQLLMPRVSDGLRRGKLRPWQA